MSKNYLRQSLTVVIPTYEWPGALDVVLRSLSEESDQDFDIVVADDGSGPQTAEVVQAWRERLGERVAYVWQPDQGFRKARVENLAAREAQGELLVFLDGDLVPRRGFVPAVRHAFRPGWFLTSKRLNLSEGLSRRVLEGRLPVWRWSALRWLVTHPRELVAPVRPRERNRPGVLLPVRDRRRSWRDDQPEFQPPHSAYCFFGIHRHDFERVNGFDMRFVGWGEEDVDMGFRLQRAGLRCGWPGPRTTLLHLWHPDRKETSSGNMQLLRETQGSERVEAAEGLRQVAGEPSSGQETANRVGASSSSSEPTNL
jgi:glycosyltransferase involved in cell wall biosynthesis